VPALSIIHASFLCDEQCWLEQPLSVCLQGKATPTEEQLSARAGAGTSGLSGTIDDDLLEAAEYDDMGNDEEQQQGGKNSAGMCEGIGTSNTPPSATAGKDPAAAAAADKGAGGKQQAQQQQQRTRRSCKKTPQKAVCTEAATAAAAGEAPESLAEAVNPAVLRQLENLESLLQSEGISLTTLGRAMSGKPVSGRVQG
jgi:hypothetical protein